MALKRLIRPFERLIRPLRNLKGVIGPLGRLIRPLGSLYDLCGPPNLAFPWLPLASLGL